MLKTLKEGTKITQIISMEIDQYNQEELSKAKQLVFAKYIGESELYHSERPTGVLLGGQPAAGKTSLIKYLIRQYRPIKFVIINGDEYRQYHPRAKQINDLYGQDAPKYTQPFSNALVEYLKAECLRLRCNFIIEGTMRTYAVIERTAKEVKQAGFRCEAHALAVHRNDSLLGVFQRFEGDKQRTGVGRFSPIDVHDEAYRQIPLNLAKADQQKLFDRLVVYGRRPDGQLVAGLDRIGDQPDSIDFAHEFDRLRQPIYPASFYHEQWLALKSLAQSRGETSADYRRQVDEFIGQFSPESA